MTNTGDKTMLKPYRQVEETDEYVVYEFRTIYLHLLYAILAMIAVGYFASKDFLSITGTFLMLLYFLLVSTQYMGLNGKIKRATKACAVEMSGSKWSLSCPLRVKIKKEFI
jgi:hypothetical protein